MGYTCTKHLLVNCIARGKLTKGGAAWGAWDPTNPLGLIVFVKRARLLPAVLPGLFCMQMSCTNLDPGQAREPRAILVAPIARVLNNSAHAGEDGTVLSTPFPRHHSHRARGPGICTRTSSNAAALGPRITLSLEGLVGRLLRVILEGNGPIPSISGRPLCVYCLFA